MLPLVCERARPARMCEPLQLAGAAAPFPEPRGLTDRGITCPHQGMPRAGTARTAAADAAATGHPPAHVGLVAIDLGRVDVPVPQAQRGQHGLVALPSRGAAVHPQPGAGQQVPCRARGGYRQAPLGKGAPRYLAGVQAATNAGSAAWRRAPQECIANPAAAEAAASALHLHPTWQSDACKPGGGTQGSDSATAVWLLSPPGPQRNV